MRGGWSLWEGMGLRCRPSTSGPRKGQAMVALEGAPSAFGLSASGLLGWGSGAAGVQKAHAWVFAHAVCLVDERSLCLEREDSKRHPAL